MDAESLIVIGSGIGAGALALDQWRRRRKAIAIINESEKELELLEQRARENLDRIDRLSEESDERVAELDELREKVLNLTEEGALAHDRYQATINSRDDNHLVALEAEAASRETAERELAEARAEVERLSSLCVDYLERIESLEDEINDAATEVAEPEAAEPEAKPAKVATKTRWEPRSNTRSVLEQALAKNEQLLSEKEKEYQDRLYKDYGRARESLGEQTPTKEEFLGFLSNTEEYLKSRQRCQVVRFKVEVRGTHVSLEPEMILNEKI